MAPLTPNTLVAPSSSLGGAMPAPKTKSRIATDKLSLYGTADDRALLQAVSKSRECMVQLCRTGPGRFHVDSGVAALKALGYGVDSSGSATYDPQAGVVSRRLVELEAVLQVEQDLVRQGCGQFRRNTEQEAAMRAEELTRSAALADCQRQLQALVQQVAAERAAAALREQQTLHDLRASLTQSSKLAADVDVELLAAELKAAEHDVAVEQRQGVRRMELLVAANKIREKWRGRSRRAKDELAFKKATLELVSDWSSHFEDLLRGRVPPEQEHLRVLWECQMRCLRSKSHRCRWHPDVLSWCADVYRFNRKAYEAMAFGNTLILPHPDTVRHHCAQAVTRWGHNDEVYNKVGEDVAGWKRASREGVLKFDAINIHAGLAWRKVSWAPGRWLCVYYAVPHDTHTPYIYILSLCAQGLYKMCIDSFTEPLLDRFSSPQKHQHRAKT